MSGHASVTLDWADGEYIFRLPLKQLEELEDRFDRSIFVITERMMTRTATSREIIEVLRLGLVGGGMKPLEALPLVKRYVEERPLDENRDVAYAICLAALARVHGDEVETAGEQTAEQSGSTSPEFMEPHS
ncbi:gene transfer agent family protein [Agrobacterium vitis]|uniref:gene transfer agent family protein n=1 Tax=Agrobacterium vitis TaxID=373 RepID=UPI0012E979A1|nr:gene transfer agent family protein [Agrobacterium vitis]MUZ65335.1 gene transfer agent family protein [Agrobacterium vitis]